MFFLFESFQKDALSFMKNYLRKNSNESIPIVSYSMLKKIVSGVPQGSSSSSILGSLLFNIFLNDISFFVGNSNLSNYVDDNTLFSF